MPTNTEALYRKSSANFKMDRASGVSPMKQKKAGNGARILKNLPLTKEMQDKINKLREHRELEIIQFEDYIGTKK